ncbi:hypothetical protein AMK22_29215 [Streptomyces sp. CB01580]|nr:hypothetical protein AMK22_29215 [Streptomyces sp. CB01580]
MADEVIGLMLQTSGEVAHPLDHERVAVLVEPTSDSTIGAGNRHGSARHGQATLELVDKSPTARTGQAQYRVDDVADIPDP